jgi:putative ABC transport system permease protein
MRFDIDAFREISQTLRRNKSRTFLTGFGVFWGMFMLLALLGGSKAVKTLVTQDMGNFATNCVIVINGTTTKPYGGFKSGRQIVFRLSDLNELRKLPGVEVATTSMSQWGMQAVYGTTKYNGANLQGVTADYAKVQFQHMKYGRFVNDMDNAEGRKVVAIGWRVYETLFPGGGDPCGKFISLNGIYYEVIGVIAQTSSNFNINGGSDRGVFCPMSVMARLYNRGDKIWGLLVLVNPEYRSSEVMNQCVNVLKKKYLVAPNDKRGIMGLNIESMFTFVKNLFSGLDILFLLVGIGTLLAGAIGVSNIMMVTVKERTTEIGIRRAIGATPKEIISQIIAESITLTIVSGMFGIIFSVLILGMVELGFTTNGVAATQFQVTFWQALLALLGLVTLGVLAGLAPASRAMQIKPVDAMREE